MKWWRKGIWIGASILILPSAIGCSASTVSAPDSFCALLPGPYIQRRGDVLTPKTKTWAAKINGRYEKNCERK